VRTPHLHPRLVPYVSRPLTTPHYLLRPDVVLGHDHLATRETHLNLSPEGGKGKFQSKW
jgi:hypothetical protein